MDFNDNLAALKAVRNRYFAQQISPQQYRIDRNRLLSTLSNQINGPDIRPTSLPEPLQGTQDDDPFC